MPAESSHRAPRPEKKKGKGGGGAGQQKLVGWRHSVEDLSNPSDDGCRQNQATEGVDHAKKKKHMHMHILLTDILKKKKNPAQQ